MKQQDVFNKIGAILNELTEQYDYLKKDTSQLNELELELFVANAHFLMDHADILRKINAQAATVAHNPVLPQPEPVKVKIEHLVEVPLPDFTERATPVQQKEETIDLNLLPAVQITEETVEKEDVVEPAAGATPEPVQPVFERPLVEKPAEVHEQKFFEPVVQQLRPVVTNELKDTPKPVEYIEDEEIVQPNDHTTIDADGTIRHELVIDDAGIWEEEEQPIEEPELFEQDEVIEADVVKPEAEPEQPAYLATASAEAVTVELAPLKTVKEELPPVVIAQTIAVEDKRDDQVFTINQRISVQMGDKSAPAALPISDLKSAITLNDKLLYVQDLFNGYSLAYSEAIDILNRFNSFTEADRFLTTNYVTKNNWQNKPATAEKFYALLKRRYA